MALPEGYRLRAGDVVSLLGTVKWPPDSQDTRVAVQITGAFRELISVDLTNVVLERRAWEVEEKVSHLFLSWEGPATVIAVHGDCVWVDVDGGPTTVLANQLVEWRDPKAPLEVDEVAVRAMTPPAMTVEEIVAAAIEEPPAAIEVEKPAPADDDDFPL